MELKGKLASVIENAAAVVVRKMTEEFVEALSIRCASGPTVFTAPPAATPIPPAATPISSEVTKVSSVATPASSEVTPAPSQAAPVSSPATPERSAGPGEGPAAAAAVLVHDLGSSLGALRAWGEALATAGVGVSAPRLPGHGTRWRDLDTVTWEQWLDTVSAQVDDLSRAHDRVFVMRLGVGATLALRLAEVRGAGLAGVAAVNPLTSRGSPCPSCSA